MIRSLITLLGLAMSVDAATAFNLNDCIINGMKGISSDAAARQIRYACDQKHKEYKSERTEKLLKDFGEVVDVDILEASKFYSPEGPGFYSIEYTNRSGEKTITFLRMEVTPAPAGPGTDCDTNKRRVYAYKLLVKPRASIKLMYPSTTSSNCLTPTIVLARPPSWKDVSLSSVVKPLEKDPFIGLD